jgi:hypothetical protein
MIFSLRMAVITGVMAAITSTSVMAQDNGTIPSQAPPSEVTFPSQPPMTSPFSPNELIDTGNRFFGGVSQGLAMIVEKAVSQWGLPNGYVLGKEASGAFVGGLRYGDGTQMPATCACSGKDRASVSTPVPMVRGL